MKYILLFLVLSLSSELHAQKMYSKQEVIKDLQYLCDVIDHNHPAPYKFHTKMQFDSLKSAIEHNLPDKLSAINAYFELRKILAFIGDIHVGFVNTPIPNDKTILDATFKIQNEKMYLERNAIDSSLNGSEIISINGFYPKKVILDYHQVVSSDAYNTSFKDEVMALRMKSVFKYFLNIKDTVKLIVKSQSGALRPLYLLYTLESKLKPIKPKLDSVLFATKNGTAKLTLTDNGNRVLILSSFANKHYKTFYKSIFTHLIQNKIDTLWIDLRNNGGGNFYNAYRLLNYMCEDTLLLTFSRPLDRSGKYFKGFQKGVRLFGFYYREIIHRGGIAKRDRRKFNTNTFYPKLPAFKGKVMVLTNGISASSSTIVAYYLKHLVNATIIGEPGGGEYGNCGGAYPKVKLPNTRMKIRIPSYWLDYNLEKNKS